MDFTREWREPPRTLNVDGGHRRVGVEIEFAAVSAQDGAEIVRRLFGGAVREEDAHRYHVDGTEFGAFTCELDSQYVHRAEDEEPLDASAGGSLIEDLQATMRELLGDVSSVVVPCEIVCPPIAIPQLSRLRALLDALSKAGAEGTRASPFYAFGAQLNPEIADDGADYLVSILKAYLLVSPWLRAIMDLDMSRRLVPFADPFPVSYTQRVLAKDYWPDLRDFMTDYLAENPTRNRELDLLPLFAWMDEDLVRRHLSDSRIKARPTFHYRLPDANIGEAGWSLALEWNRWLVVERLAEDRGLLEQMGRAYLNDLAYRLRSNWDIECSQWLVLSGLGSR